MGRDLCISLLLKQAFVIEQCTLKSFLAIKVKIGKWKMKIFKNIS